MLTFLPPIDRFGTYSTSEAINAGRDLEMPGPPRWRGTALNHAVTSNKIPLATLNARVRAMLKLFQKASKSGISERAPETQSNQAEDRNPARKIAAEGIVLLKNEENILLFNKNKRIPVIGTNAKIATYRGGGSAVLNPYYTVTPFDGISGSALSGVGFAQQALLRKSSMIHQRRQPESPSRNGMKPIDDYIHGL